MFRWQLELRTMNDVDRAMHTDDFGFAAPSMVCRESGRQTTPNPLACLIGLIVVMIYEVCGLASWHKIEEEEVMLSTSSGSRRLMHDVVGFVHVCLTSGFQISVRPSSWRSVQGWSISLLNVAQNFQRD